MPPPSPPNDILVRNGPIELPEDFRAGAPLGAIPTGGAVPPDSGRATCRRQSERTNVCLLPLDTPKRPFRIREEFRAPRGVRKSPRNEPAGHRRWSMGISVFG
jgi:hypothetical protein